MSRVVTVGLVGCGNWCRNYHLPLLLEKMPDRFRVVGVCDKIAERTASAAELTHAPGFGSVEELLKATDPELVYIVTKPPTMHYEVARVALQAGKHVFTEKPMCATAAQCDELIALARQKSRILTVHHNRRWEVPFLVARRVLTDGLVGTPYYVMSSHPSTWCGPADLLVDWGIHIADQILQVAAPAKPVEVSCVVCNPPEAGTRSGPWRATVRCDTGLAVDAFQLLLAPGAMPKWLVCGSTGSCTMSVPFDVRMETGPVDVEIPSLQRGREGKDEPAFTLRIDQVHYHELLHRAIVDGAPVPVAPAGARNAVALSSLLVEAATSQRTVTVPAGYWLKED